MIYFLIAVIFIIMITVNRTLKSSKEELELVKSRYFELLDNFEAISSKYNKLEKLFINNEAILAKIDPNYISYKKRCLKEMEDFYDSWKFNRKLNEVENHSHLEN